MYLNSGFPREVLLGIEHPQMERGDGAIPEEIRSKEHCFPATLRQDPPGQTPPFLRAAKEVHKGPWLQSTIPDTRKWQGSAADFTLTLPWIAGAPPQMTEAEENWFNYN